MKRTVLAHWAGAFSQFSNGFETRFSSGELKADGREHSRPPGRHGESCGAVVKALLAQFCRKSLRWGGGNLACCAIWLALALVFLSLAAIGYRGIDQRVSRAGFRLPPAPIARVGQPRVREMLDDLAQRYDTAAAALERSIRSSARTGFWLNLISASLSLAALTVQWQSARARSLGLVNAGGKWPPEEAGQLTFSSPQRRPLLSPMPVTHDGSFPDAGYSR